MKYLFVPYELALKLKHKGFNEDCFAEYHPFGKSLFLCEISQGRIFKRHLNIDRSSTYFFAPLYQQAFDWLEKTHKIRIDLLTSEATGKYKYNVRTLQDGKWVKEFNPISFFTKQERNDKAIEIALEMI